MSRLHAKHYLHSGDTIVVECSHLVNVLVMNDDDYRNYKNNRAFDFHGGFFKNFPVHITVPSTGLWNIVITLPPGQRGDIKHSISIISA
ncbi:TPA: DUF1883 domain-containing protein [Yersinia enterocolitica]|nr:DUF1883 domain-containing protein [Yersinia enterocolitica]